MRQQFLTLQALAGASGHIKGGGAVEKLHAFRLTPQNLPALAAFMARARPQWWDEAGAAGQLSGTELTIGTVGWLLGRMRPTAACLCRELFYTAAWKVECCGFFEQGRFFRAPTGRAV